VNEVSAERMSTPVTADVFARSMNCAWAGARGVRGFVDAIEMSDTLVVRHVL
jgi:hypothetical protein